MADARGHRITITVEADGALFQAGGKTIDFPGYLRAYVEGSDDPEAELADREVVLPPVAWASRCECRELEPKSHTTQPPNRYSEAALTRALEEMGIGRPSTYASIIDTILAREYVFKRSAATCWCRPGWPLPSAQLLEAHLPDLVDYSFTAEMEDELDAISRGEMGHLDYLRHFYFGNGHPGLKQQLEEQGRRDRRPRRQPHPASASRPGGPEVFVRVGRYGPFLEQGERRASLPDKMPPDELTLASRPWKCSTRPTRPKSRWASAPRRGKPVYLKIGRFGPYVQRGTADDEEKPQNASLLKGMKPEDVTLEVALQLLSLPRHVGRASADRPAGGGPQRPIRPVRQVRRGDPLAAGRRFRRWT